LIARAEENRGRKKRGTLKLRGGKKEEKREVWPDLKRGRRHLNRERRNPSLRFKRGEKKGDKGLPVEKEKWITFPPI